MNSSTFYVSSFTIEEGALSLNEHDTDDLKCFPNPIKDQLTISSTTMNLGRIVVFNASGQLLFNTRPHMNEYSLILASYASGFYFVKVTSKESSKVFKIVKE